MIISRLFFSLFRLFHKIKPLIYLQSVSVEASVCGIEGGGGSAGGVHLLGKRHVGEDVLKALMENGVELFGYLQM